MYFGGSQDEYGMRGWFLQCLEQGIKCRRGEHVDFIYDIDLVFSLVWGKIDLFAQITHIVHPIVGGCIDFDHIQE